MTTGKNFEAKTMATIKYEGKSKYYNGSLVQKRHTLFWPLNGCRNLERFSKTRARDSKWRPGYYRGKWRVKTRRKGPLTKTQTNTSSFSTTAENSNVSSNWMKSFVYGKQQMTKLGEKFITKVQTDKQRAVDLWAWSGFWLPPTSYIRQNFNP